MLRAAVVMAVDAAYAPFAAVLADSIVRHHPARDFDICLCSPDELDLPADLRALGLRSIRLPGANPYAGGPHQSRHGAETYLRLLLPGLLAAEYDRLLYLDSDILCGGAGIGRLLRADLGGHWLGAVRDNTQWRTPARRNPEFRAAGLPALPYFNAGVLLVDTAAWVAAEVEGQALRLFRDRPAAMTRHDQSLLNLIAGGRWAEMSPVWNWQYTWSSRFFADLADPRLVHFIGPRKPWKDEARALPARFRAPYAAMAGQWPGQPALAGLDPAGPAWPPGLGRMFLKHWWSAARMRAYLARFPDPFRLVPAAEGGVAPRLALPGV